MISVGGISKNVKFPLFFSLRKNAQIHVYHLKKQWKKSFTLFNILSIVHLRPLFWDHLHEIPLGVVLCETLILEPFLFDFLPQVSTLPHHGTDPLRVRFYCKYRNDCLVLNSGDKTLQVAFVSSPKIENDFQFSVLRLFTALLLPSLADVVVSCGMYLMTSPSLRT